MTFEQIQATFIPRMVALGILAQNANPLRFSNNNGETSIQMDLRVPFFHYRIVECFSSMLTTSLQASGTTFLTINNNISNEQLDGALNELQTRVDQGNAIVVLPQRRGPFLDIFARAAIVNVVAAVAAEAVAPAEEEKNEDEDSSSQRINNRRR